MPKISKKDEKQLLLLKSTYQMHLKSREQCALRGKTDSVERLDIIIKDTLAQMAKISPEFAQKCYKEEMEKGKKENIEDIAAYGEDSGSVFDAIGTIDENDMLEPENELNVADTTEFYKKIGDPSMSLYDVADEFQSQSVSEKQEDMIYNNVDTNAQYDLIPLPSKGECYKNKIDRIPVGYLTASDENLITSPNLYESGSITNILLKKKILNKNINVDELVAGDVDAIMVFLRGTSYGNEFPIVATEPNTGKKIETTVDLSKLTYKPFSLKSDENGYFDYTLPRTKAVVKFKFLTKGEERLLQKLNKSENDGIASIELADAVEKVKNALMTDTTLSDSDKNNIIAANKKLEEWSNNLRGKSKHLPYTKTITNTMEMQIISIDGNTDKRAIHEFVMNMPASDSLAFRRYIYDNQPGVNFEVEIERPESMGGGSFKCFLEWDDYVFWHIA